jgi:maleylacetate reductase
VNQKRVWEGVRTSRPETERLQFTHDTLGQRVLFGRGLARENLGAEVARLGSIRPMLIASPAESGLAERICADFSVATWFDEVVEHVPVEVAQRARAVASATEVDLLVSVGGGSTTGLAKAVAMTTGLPIVAVPTTYAGSEATNVWGLTEARRKTTGTDDSVLPVSVVYDAELTMSLPAELSIASGLNALAHCVDSLWAPHADPINKTFALEGARVLNRALRVIAENPHDPSGREDAQYAAYLAAVAFASAGSGLHHKICHALGGAFGLPHAPTHAVVLPHVLAFNAPAAAEPVSRLAAALEDDDAMAGLDNLLDAVDAPRSLRQLGLAKSSLEEAVEVVLPLIPPSNPRAVDREAVVSLIGDAWSGALPRATVR